MKPAQFLVQRLGDLIWPDLPVTFLNDHCQFEEAQKSLWRRTSVKTLLEHAPFEKYIDENLRMSKEAFLRYRAAGDTIDETLQYLDEDWDISRARYFYDQLLAGRTLDPISVDNVCNHGHIYAMPVLIDGHHRLGASMLAGVKTIPVHYGGRLDLKAFLTGRRKTCPTD